MNRKRENDPLQPLYLFDPDLAGKVQEGIDACPVPPSREDVTLLVEETLWGISQEISFGITVAEGFTALLQKGSPEQRTRYRRMVREAAQQSGPTLARMIAESLVPVLQTDDPDFLAHFLAVIRIIRAKGDYALVSPLDALSCLLNAGDSATGRNFLHLLEKTFQQEMNYNQCKQVANLLAQFCGWLSDQGKTWMMTELNRVIQLDVALAEPFIDSLKGELGFLDCQGLSAFVSLGIEKYQGNPEFGEKFLALQTQVAVEACRELQRVVPLKQVRLRLNRYLQAATGLSLQVRPAASLPDVPAGINRNEPFVISDGRYLYLPDEISAGSRRDNLSLYKVLVRLEAGLYEFQTFSFDFLKAVDQCRARNIGSGLLDDPQVESRLAMELTDMERFCHLFPDPRLAADLFTVFEHGRIWMQLHRTSPGVPRQALPFLRKHYEQNIRTAGDRGILLNLYAAVAIDPEMLPHADTRDIPIVNRLASRFADAMQYDSSVETVAALVLTAYPEVESYLPDSGRECSGPVLPFSRRLYPELYAQKSHYRQQKKAEQMQRVFQSQGVRIYRSDIQKQLEAQSGNLSRDDIQTLIIRSGEPESSSEDTARNILMTLRQDALLEAGRQGDSLLYEEGDYPSFRYDEWDMDQSDYLRDHVLVREKPIREKPGTFYQDTVSHFHGLIRQIRHSFELLKPEGLSILRRWGEGDAFDYRALLDFAIEKRIGLTPSERIYIKRVKQVRDVSVLVLVDLSRSTSNLAAGTEKSVLTIEKEAIVLLCEALTVVGDSFAIAGFSGTGRLGVDYFPVKEFHEDMKEPVRQRIHAMQPLRSTRLGAAIRHAAGRLEVLDSKVRLLLIISDGYPNDNGYKQDYAIQDTRKALLEARSKNIFTHGITVNISGDSQLDHLYGKLHHSLISDVSELPDKLFRIYGNLTG